MKVQFQFLWVFICASFYIFALSANCQRKDTVSVELKFTTDKDSLKNENILFVYIVNETPNDLYLIGLNPFVNIKFFSNFNTDISKRVWDDFYYNLSVPAPFDSSSIEKEDKYLSSFMNCAIEADLDSIKVFGNANFKKEDIAELAEMVKFKYERVTLIKKGESFEIKYVFTSLNEDLLSSIILDYNYNSFFKGADDYYLYKKGEVQYLLKNLPLQEVCGYSLFQGSLKDTLNFKLLTE